MGTKMIKCRICNTEVEKIMSFGKMPIANGFLTQEEFEKEYFFELAPAFCNHCKTFQIIEQPAPEKMFHENYAFFSSTSSKMQQHFKEMAEHYMEEFVPDKKKAFVVELGSNDGIMLKNFSKNGIPHLGIEPSKNVAEVARQNGVNTISEFFGEEVAKKVAAQNSLADIISAANVMCHIPDIISVAKGVKALLKPSGIFVFEDPYLGDMFRKTSYDQIYDEHVYIFSVQSVQNIFKPYDLELFHVAPQETHGGSMRYYLCHRGAYSVRDSVNYHLKAENSLGLDKVETYQSFKEACERNKNNLIALLKKIKSEGKKIVGYAATSKSTTILNYCGIGPELIDYISDTTPIKQDKFSPGMHIPIKSYDDFKKDKPEYAVLFAWNHAKEIFEKEKDFARQGGKWILFVPDVRVLNSEESVLNHVA
jgi:methylation protein EvaC